MSARKIVENWKDTAAQLLKIGATAYGGPAIMGIMQAELQEKRQWVSKERFVEGLSLVNMLPGASAAQLSMFLGYARGGWGVVFLAGRALSSQGSSSCWRSRWAMRPWASPPSCAARSMAWGQSS